MAETQDGKKFNRIPSYTRVVKGKTVVVKSHDRSNPTTSAGTKKQANFAQ